MSPGRARFARMFVTRKGVEVRREYASDDRRTCPPPLPSIHLWSTWPLPLHAHDLPQRMDDIDELALRVHHVVDRLVRRWRLVNDVRVLPAFDTLGGFRVILHREPLLRRGA